MMRYADEMFLKYEPLLVTKKNKTHEKKEVSEANRIKIPTLFYVISFPAVIFLTFLFQVLGFFLERKGFTTFAIVIFSIYLVALLLLEVLKRFGRNDRESIDKAKELTAGVLANVILAFLSFLVLFPLLFMIFSSFRSTEEYFAKIAFMFPKNWFNFDNYRRILVDLNLVSGYKNTLIIVFAVIPCGTLFAAMAAFSFAKLKLRSKTFWLLFLLSGMMVPGAVLLMPRYIFYSTVGWIDTLYPLIIPHLFIHVGTMFFFIQYMKGIPSELFEAAKIDGCSTFRSFLQIMLPLLLPAVAAQDIFWFMGIWNDYFAPSIYLRSTENMTLQVLMASINSSFSGSGQQTVVFAGAVMSCLPMVIVYLILQKFFIKSMSIGAVKG